MLRRDGRTAVAHRRTERVRCLITSKDKTDQFIRRHQRVAPEKTFEEYMQPWIARIPVRRVGDPDEFANMACFLASDAASSVNGTAINMDGGASPVV